MSEEVEDEVESDGRSVVGGEREEDEVDIVGTDGDDGVGSWNGDEEDGDERGCLGDLLMDVSLDFLRKRDMMVVWGRPGTGGVEEPTGASDDALADKVIALSRARAPILTRLLVCM